MIPVRHFIVATAGHVDHGKSSLVKALTSIDPDRLPEEKARGITIDVGFAHLELPAPGDRHPPGSVFSFGIVDVPGHEDFVKNMVAGVGSIDLALFIVAADDGWMPQTEEHLQILHYLGVQHAVVALTKSDLCADVPAAINAVRSKLLETPFADAPIVPTSIVTSQGLDLIQSSLANALSQVASPRDFAKPRLPVDRAFSLRGFGTVVTGTLTGGKLHRNQPVIIQPGGITTRVRTIQSHNQDAAMCEPGTRVALNLPDVAVASDSATAAVRRGDIIALPDSGSPGDTADVALTRSIRAVGSLNKADRLLKNGVRVRVHTGTANCPARLFLLGVKELHAGQQALGQIRFELPQFLLAGDRFIVRDWSEQATLAGGFVLDPAANRRAFRTVGRKQFLEGRAANPTCAATWISSLLIRDKLCAETDLLRQSRFSEEEISAAATSLAGEGKAVRVAGFVINADHWRATQTHAMRAIDEFHRAHPERPGLPLNDLRNSLESQLAGQVLFAASLSRLCTGGFTQAGLVIRRTSHRQSLPPHLNVAGERLRSAFAAKPLEPPSRKELTPDLASQQALRFLVETGEVVELGAEVVIAAAACQRILGIITAHLGRHGKATVSELRQAIGTSRRILMPLLEKLDRTGVTVRQGDWRVPGHAFKR